MIVGQEISPGTRPDLFYLPSASGVLNQPFLYGIEQQGGVPVHAIYFPARDALGRITRSKILFSEFPDMFVQDVDTGNWRPEFRNVRFVTEWKEQQGAPGNFRWTAHHTTLNTTLAGGETDMLTFWARKVNADGSMTFRKTYSADESGVAETIAETWNIPATAPAQPKITLSCTSHRGIKPTRGVQEGEFRAHWKAITPGVATEDNDVREDLPSGRVPVRKLRLDDREHGRKMTWTDFGHAAEVQVSQTAGNVNVLFFKDGANPSRHGAGWRTIDPTLSTSSTSTTVEVRNYSHSGNPSAATEWRMVFDKAVGGMPNILMIGDGNNRIATFTMFDLYGANGANTEVSQNGTSVTLSLTIASGAFAYVAAAGTITSAGNIATYTLDCYIWPSGDLFVVGNLTSTTGSFPGKYFLNFANATYYTSALLSSSGGNNGVMKGISGGADMPIATYANVGTDWAAALASDSQEIFQGYASAAPTAVTWRYKQYLVQGTAVLTDALNLMNDYRAPYVSVLTGTMVTTDPGDADADGYNESRGHYTIQASSNQVIVKTDTSGGTRSAYQYYRPSIKITNWTSTTTPKVEESTDDGVTYNTLVLNNDYNITTISDEGQVGTNTRMFQRLTNWLGTGTAARRYRFTVPTALTVNVSDSVHPADAITQFGKGQIAKDSIKVSEATVLFLTRVISLFKRSLSTVPGKKVRFRTSKGN